MPEPQDDTSPAAVIIENRPRRAWFFLAVWMIELLAGVAFAVSGWRWLGAHENGAAAVLIAMGLVLVAAGVVMTAHTFRIARLNGAALILTPHGFTDRRIAEAEIPWTELRWRIVFNGRSYAVHVDLDAPARQSYRPYWEQRVMGGFHRLFGYPEFQVTLTGTGQKLAQLAVQLRKFSPET